jgi:alkanesulfonate monooxygenase SsuD/methylene tetrahydromethanopterin reductase-like flavin-dependent oxidoreductase (luciferase family)
MKLLWFHLMPYTELPDDFRAKHPSVWVDIDSRLFDPERAHHMYNDFMDELEYAAEVGLDGVCVNEHHSNGYGLMPSPNLIASHLARRTADAAICVMGNSLALYNPPTRVAEEFAMIDCISGGRLIAGFPVGTPMDTCYAYGQNPASLRARYLEAHDLVMEAWRRPEPFAFNGRFNQQRYINIWPRPVQKPHPPIWIPGGGSVETWQWCARMDYVYSYLSYFGYKAGQATMKGFWDEMTRLGKDRNPYRAGFLQFVGVAETEKEALALYREPAEYFYDRCLRLDPRFAQPPGYTSEATVRARVESMVVRAADQALARKPPATAFQDILDEGYVVVGTPDQVAEKVREIAVNLNVGHLMLLMQFGSSPSR